MTVIDNISLTFLVDVIVVQQHWWGLGLLGGAVVIASDAEEESISKKVFWLLGGASCLPIFAYFLIPYLSTKFGISSVQPSVQHLGFWFGCSVVSWLFAIYFLRDGIQKLDIFKKKVTKTTQLERNRKTDVRDINKHLPAQALSFDPLKHIDKAKGVFLGLDEQKKPVYIEFGSGMSAPHVQVVGTTGAGKGVSLGVMASQFLECGEAVFFCDPKNDEWAPSVMYAAAQRSGKPYHYINLNRPHGAQINLFEGVTEEEAFELFQAGFGLSDKGGDADFYGIDDRQEAMQSAKVLTGFGLTVAELYSQRVAAHQDPNFAKKFIGRLREMAETPSINAKSGGVSLEQVVNEGGCVYIVGSMRNDIVKTAQRILLVRMIQLAERRDRMAGGELRKICIVLDEVKYHLSKPALEALGAARDKGVHLVLAHQSLGDLKDCTADLNPDAVVDAVVENCRLKLCYKVQSPVTAEWLAQMSGKILVDDESRDVKKNIAQTETLGERRISQSERYFIDENMLLNLPAGVAVLYGAGLPRFVSICPLLVEKSVEAVRIVTLDGAAPFSISDKVLELESLDEVVVPQCENTLTLDLPPLV